MPKTYFGPEIVSRVMTILESAGVSLTKQVLHTLWETISRGQPYITLAREDFNVDWEFTVKDVIKVVDCYFYLYVSS